MKKQNKRPSVYPYVISCDQRLQIRDMNSQNDMDFQNFCHFSALVSITSSYSPFLFYQGTVMNVLHNYILCIYTSAQGRRMGWWRGKSKRGTKFRIKITVATETQRNVARRSESQGKKWVERDQDVTSVAWVRKPLGFKQWLAGGTQVAGLEVNAETSLRGLTSLERLPLLHSWGSWREFDSHFRSAILFIYLF